MKKIRLTETELTSLIRNIVIETQNEEMNEEMENYFNPEAMETGEAIVTIIGTVIGMLGIAGSHYIKAAIKKLRKSGNDAEADKVEEALQAEMSKMKSREMSSGEDEPVMESRIVRRRK
jgi:hypothetical protein